MARVAPDEMRLIPKSRRGRNELDGLWALTARGLTRCRPTGAPTCVRAAALGERGDPRTPPSTRPSVYLLPPPLPRRCSSSTTFALLFHIFQSYLRLSTTFDSNPSPPISDACPICDRASSDPDRDSFFLFERKRGD